MLKLRKFAAVFSIPLLAACASTQPLGGAPDVSVAELSALPAPGVADFMPDAQYNLLRPLDVVQIEVFGVPELTRSAQVGATGSLDFPLIGTVPAMGRTPEELSLDIETRLRGTYVLDPDVTTRITERSQQLFTISGEVSRPGRYPITAPISLMEAVALGGGLEEYAKRDEVLVFRTVGENRYIGVYNLQGIQRGNYADPTIYASDVVIVGDSPGRRRLDSILDIVSSVLTPLVLIQRATR
ncbi:polysaccharide biosynthesis/export family protein [Erythrobacter alti]|uniref:polysaccharide biosynthesis/export family protein n=1 Tax=Erythrobacter alti TaxID=1896145 RepID=UPI0030F46831